MTYTIRLVMGSIVSIYLSDELYEKLLRMARAKGKSVGKLVQAIVEEKVREWQQLEAS